MKIASPAADDELTRIGEKLLAQLPPTGIHYRFRIYDSGEVNGFSIAGGRVYISRKLVSSVNNENELAGVLARELGHLTTHQTAIEMARIFKVQIGVTQVRISGKFVLVEGRTRQYGHLPSRHRRQSR